MTTTYCLLDYLGKTHCTDKLFSMMKSGVEENIIIGYKKVSKGGSQHSSMLLEVSIKLRRALTRKVPK